MRIVIDLQGAQTGSRFRGIGRYSFAVAQGIVRHAGTHEVWLVLNGAHTDSVLEIRRIFEGTIPQDRICVFEALPAALEEDPVHGWHTGASEKIREHFIEKLCPDIVLVTSLFEGYDAVASVGTLCGAEHTAVILYDLIPLLNPTTYLTSPAYERYYNRKVESLKRAGLLLSISDYSRQEGIDALNLDPENVVSISTAADAHFMPDVRSTEETAELFNKYGIARNMVMYAPGGFDPRKNIDGLITAYSLLPQESRNTYQLVIVSKLGEAERLQLNARAKNAGLGSDELVLTGYVPDEDLRALYSACTLFVIPSKHEGFGLPALEAMACGAPVIGSNSTSIPEVIGLEEALFDPASPQEIAEKIQYALENPAFRDFLRTHGAAQAKKFSWDVTAQRALRAMEKYVSKRALSTATDQSPDSSQVRKPRLAFVSPLPPEKAGIADYSAELLTELADHYTIELVNDQQHVNLPESVVSLPLRSVQWFAEHGSEYDRVLYHFGNSTFHTHMFDLIHQYPGVVVLHDFFFNGVLAHEEITERRSAKWTEALYYSHGYRAAQERFSQDRLEHTWNTYPCNLEVLQTAKAVIVHSPYSKDLARRWYGHAAGNDWSVVPLLRIPAQDFDRTAARKALGIPENAFVVCSFGLVDRTKHSRRLVEAWLSSHFAANPSCQLILVGENHGADYGAQLLKLINSSKCRSRVHITGWNDAEVYRQYLMAADVGIQLRQLSRGETSAAVLDCMNYGLATIVNANGSMAYLPDDCVIKLPEVFEDEELIAAIDTLYSNPEQRSELGKQARQTILTKHSPQNCAEQYVVAIETAYRNTGADLNHLLSALADIPQVKNDDTAMRHVSRAVARSTRLPIQQRQLLVDVSAISRDDLKTGIERVARAQLLELLSNPPDGFRIEPVYLSPEGGAWHYRYARRYMKKLLGFETHVLVDAPVDVSAGDIFYSPDYYPGGVIEAAKSRLYDEWRARGVEINFLVFDLLPVLRPEFFPPESDHLHAEWLKCIAKNSHRLICISNAVADELLVWLDEHLSASETSVKVAAIHLGADIHASAPSAGMPSDAASVLKRLSSTQSFLMVGTIEPRKGHLQTITAFEELWHAGQNVNLVIVGNEGWKPLPSELRRTIPEIASRLSTHPELGKRLFWLQGISDEYLQRVYDSCVCLIAASEGEGFGLPLIEAAQHNMPIIARDIPVFREVAGKNAFYFDGMAASNLASAVQTWNGLNQNGTAPDSKLMQWITWEQSTNTLRDLMLGQKESRVWPIPQGVAVVYDQDISQVIDQVTEQTL